LEQFDDELTPGPAALVPGPEVEDEVTAAVLAAWEEILGPGSLERNRSFVDAGGDSLEVIRFVLALQERLGTSIPPDAVSLAMCPLDLVSRLAARPRRPESPERLFIVPPAPGSALHHLRLVAMLGPAIRAQLVPLPSLEDEWRSLPSIDAMAEACAGWITARAPTGPIALLGLCFGALVAWSAATRLVAAGRLVTFLGIGDSGPWARPPARARTSSLVGYYVGVPRRLHRLAALAFRLLVHHSARHGVPAVARSVVHLLAGFLTAKDQHRLRVQTILALRAAKVAAWQPAHLPIPVTLFRSVETARQFTRLQDDLGWAALADEVRVVTVEGDHATYVSHNLERFAAEVTQAIGTSAVLPRSA
jgi:thioesterase domain-containing protein/acyl carrier protein